MSNSCRVTTTMVRRCTGQVFHAVGVLNENSRSRGSFAASIPQRFTWRQSKVGVVGMS